MTKTELTTAIKRAYWYESMAKAKKLYDEYRKMGGKKIFAEIVQR